jgi:hypothetical protein
VAVIAHVPLALVAGHLVSAMEQPVDPPVLKN